MNTYFRTYTGLRAHPLDPRTDEIAIEDIARSLSNQCRFLGHVKRFYSVAQHSVLVSRICEPPDALWGLLHDASEAFLCDLPAPIKREPEMIIYRMAEGILQSTVARRFGLRPEMPDSVCRADRLLLATEFRDVTTVEDEQWISDECGVAPMAGYRILPWPAPLAETQFLNRFRELTHDAARIPERPLAV